MDYDIGESLACLLGGHRVTEYDLFLEQMKESALVARDDKYIMRSPNTPTSIQSRSS